MTHQIYNMAAMELHHRGPDELNASEKHMHMPLQNEFAQPTRNLNKTSENLPFYLSVEG